MDLTANGHLHGKYKPQRSKIRKILQHILEQPDQTVPADDAAHSHDLASRRIGYLTPIPARTADNIIKAPVM